MPDRKTPRRPDPRNPAVQRTAHIICEMEEQTVLAEFKLEQSRPRLINDLFQMVPA